jgi:thioredoxin-related protein
MESETILLVILIVLLFVLYYFSSCKSEHFHNNQAANENENSINTIESPESNEYNESFNSGNSENAGDAAILMVFLTKHCPHCVSYDRSKHANLSKELGEKANIKVKRVYADEDPENLFDANEIQFVPAALVMKGNNKIKVNGDINFNNVVATTKKL